MTSTKSRFFGAHTEDIKKPVKIRTGGADTQYGQPAGGAGRASAPTEGEREPDKLRCGHAL